MSNMATEWCNQDKYQYFKNVQQKISEIKYPIEFEYTGHQFTCLRGVFPGGSGDQYIHHLPLEAKSGGNAVLEVGCGTGCVSTSLYLWRKGLVGRVLGTDISPQAVENTAINFQRYGVPGKSFTSDVFDAVDEEEKFDLIFWHYPYVWVPSTEKLSTMDKSLADVGYEGIGRYVREAENYLTSQGKAVVIFSPTTGNKDALVQVVKSHGRELKLIREDEVHTCFVPNKIVQVYEVLGA